MGSKRISKQLATTIKMPWSLLVLAGGVFALGSASLGIMNGLAQAAQAQPPQKDPGLGEPASDTPGKEVTPGTLAPAAPIPTPSDKPASPAVRPNLAPGTTPTTPAAKAAARAAALTKVDPKIDPKADPRGTPAVAPGGATPNGRQVSMPPVEGRRPVGGAVGGDNAAGGEGGAGVSLPGAGGPVPEGWFRYGPSAEPVKLKLLADEVAAFLGIQYMGNDTSLADKQVFLPTAIDVPKDQLMDFLSLLLEQNGMVLKTTGIGKIYSINAANESGGGNVGQDAFSATRIIATPGIKPSSLQQPITTLLSRSGGGAPGQPQQGGPGGTSIAYLDELGVILITDSPRRIQSISSLIDALITEQAKQEYTRFELKYLAATSARTRMIELLGRPNSGSGLNQQQGNPNPQVQNPQGGVGGTIANLPDRLFAEPTSNALLFRGRADETAILRRLLPLVDTRSVLQGRWYPISAALQVAQQAERTGLGKVITVQTGNSSSFNNNNSFPGSQLPPNIQSQQQLADQNAGGPVILVDGQGRGFTYFATPDLHERMNVMVADLKDLTESESVVYEHYKIKHQKAEDLATIIQSLINNVTPSGTSSLLPGPGQQNPSAGLARQPNTTTNNTTVRTGRGSDTENLAIEGSPDVFVLADKSNNQVIVKAPKRLQPQFSRLIAKLDLRRPQVYLEARIVVIDDNDNWRLAFEQQLVKGILNNNAEAQVRTAFGLSTAATLKAVPTVAPVANALTAAIVRNDQVPLIITALAATTDAKVMAAPTLLVDDNEEAEISAVRENPTTTTTTATGVPTQTSFGGFQEAGPKLKVTPQISANDFLRLEYELELSSFVGTPTTAQPVPPRSTTKIKNKSVTIPSDSTIIVGGLTSEDYNRTVNKVPLLGDIPFLGQLFRDESENKQRRTVYVFITPRVLRDTNFNDSRLLSQAPLAASKLPPSSPPMVPAAYIELDKTTAPSSTPLLPTGPAQPLPAGGPAQPMTQPSSEPTTPAPATTPPATPATAAGVQAKPGKPVTPGTPQPPAPAKPAPPAQPEPPRTDPTT